MNQTSGETSHCGSTPALPSGDVTADFHLSATARQRGGASAARVGPVGVATVPYRSGCVCVFLCVRVSPQVVQISDFRLQTGPVRSEPPQFESFVAKVRRRSCQPLSANVSMLAFPQQKTLLHF